MVSLYVTDAKARGEVAAALVRLLADSFFLYLKTRVLHWSAVGSHVAPLHSLFRQQYTELGAAIDEIDERMRALGARVPRSFAAFMSLTSLTEETGIPAAGTVIRQLEADHAVVARTARRAAMAAETRGHVAVADLAAHRTARHEKTARMLGRLAHSEIRTRQRAPTRRSNKNADGRPAAKQGSRR